MRRRQRVRTISFILAYPPSPLLQTRGIYLLLRLREFLSRWAGREWTSTGPTTDNCGDCRIPPPDYGPNLSLRLP